MKALKMLKLAMVIGLFFTLSACEEEVISKKTTDGDSQPEIPMPPEPD